MDDAIHVKVLDSFHDLLKVVLGFFFLNLPLLLKERVEISIFTELSNDVHVVGGLVDVIKLDDIGVVHFLHDFDFGLDVLDVVAVGEKALIDDFNCHFLPGLDYSAHVYVGVGALAQQVFHIELVLFDSLLSFHHVAALIRLLNYF